jgi:hypothetical protein
MSQPITNNTRTGAIKTTSPVYFFNIEGDFSSNTFSLDWSEDGVNNWTPIKDLNDDDVTRTANSNGTVTTGKNGYLSGIVASGAGHTIRLSLIAV